MAADKLKQCGGLFEVFCFFWRGDGIADTCADRDVLLEKGSRTEAGAYCFLRESVASDDQVGCIKTQAVHGVS